MAQGKPTKWAQLTVNQEVWLNKAGISIVVWDKWGKKRRGTLTVSIGGLRWRPYKGKKPQRYSWNELAGG